jgi:hypothetical protein
VTPTERQRGGKPERTALLVGVGALLLALALLVLDFFGPSKEKWENFLEDHYGDVAFVLLGVAGTVLIIDRLNATRAHGSLVSSLIRDMAGADHGLALRAARELHAAGEVTNGRLDGVDLSGGALSGVDLRRCRAETARLIGTDLAGADLSAAVLARSDLSHAILKGANLEGSDLRECCLSEADLSQIDAADACLEGADLSGARCIGADLRRVNLSQAILRGCDLTDVHWEGAVFAAVSIDEETVADPELLARLRGER